jgi:hypothetical protein
MYKYAPAMIEIIQTSHYEMTKHLPAFLESEIGVFPVEAG